MPDIPEDITFDTRDEYLRRPIAERVIGLLTGEAHVSPVVIDGSWGTGKTEFCRKLTNLLESQHPRFKAVYVDAFTSDHADQPLMTLLAAVLKVLPDSERPTLLKKAIPAIRFGLKTTLKAGVSWVLKQDVADIADDFDDDLKKAGDEAVNAAIERMLRDHVEAESSLLTLRKALEQLTAEQPIVVFVDELDRCRPDFAVSLLEVMKHVFDVEGLQFVLVTNSNQLIASINHCYGQSVDARRYLDKFLGFSFVLPHVFKHDGHNSIEVSIRHFEELVSKSKYLKDSCVPQESVRSFLHDLIEQNMLSLREVETLAQYCEIYQALTGNEGLTKRLIFGYALLRVFAIYIFCFDPPIAEGIAAGRFDTLATLKLLGKESLYDLSCSTHPSNTDVVAAMVVLENEVTSRNLYPDDQETIDAWTDLIHAYFRGGHSFPDDRHISVMQSTVNTLKLYE